MITAAYGLACEVVPDQVSGTPMVVPRVRHHAAPAAGDGSPVAAPQD